MEHTINAFFRNLFPMAYLSIINTNDTSTHLNQIKYFHPDHHNCLVRVYDQFEPFGSLPHQISDSLYRSVGAASTFIKALIGGVDVLRATEQIEIEHLDKSCSEALFKMSYCSSCQGYNGSYAKPCYSYCINVMRFVEFKFTENYLFFKIIVYYFDYL